MTVVTKSILKVVYPKKPKWSHKGQYGRLLVVSGSKWMAGAPSLIGFAALKSGLDTIYFTGPKRAMDVTAASFPTFINNPMDCDFLGIKQVGEVLDFAEEMRVTGLVIGPGLYRKPDTRKAIIRVVESLDVPMVIDADAIRSMSAAPRILKNKVAVLLPHTDEFRELTGVKIVNDIDVGKRSELVRKQSERLGTVIVLKGNVDIISDGKRTLLNKTGSYFMTKGGFGDTMAGICGALLSRRINKVDAFSAGVATAYINGRAGELAARKYGLGMLPTDLINEIPNVIKLGRS